jgi:hypothetical protein
MFIFLQVWDGTSGLQYISFVAIVSLSIREAQRRKITHSREMFSIVQPF